MGRQEGKCLQASSTGRQIKAIFGPCDYYNYWEDGFFSRQTSSGVKGTQFNSFTPGTANPRYATEESHEKDRLSSVSLSLSGSEEHNDTGSGSWWKRSRSRSRWKGLLHLSSVHHSVTKLIFCLLNKHIGHQTMCHLKSHQMPESAFNLCNEMRCFQIMKIFNK